MICSQCSKEFIKISYAQKYCSKECSRKAKNEGSKRFSQTSKSKEYQKKYKQTDAFKKSLKKYQSTDKGKESAERYRTSEKGIKNAKKQIKKYKHSYKGKVKMKNYIKDKIKTDPIFKLKMNMRSRLSKFFSSSNIRKTNHTFKMVGCTPEFLKKHLEKQFYKNPKTNEQMTWKNHNKKGWHIDHKKPISLAKTFLGVEKLSHYTNLQPMWATENLKKGSKII